MNSVFSTAVVIPFFVFCTFSNCFGITLGFQGDGISDIRYDSITGDLDIIPDGHPDGVGAFQIISTSGIFTGDAANFPSGGIFETDTDNELLWVGLPVTATSTRIRLGKVAQPGLLPSFLLADLTTVRGSGGLGTPNRDFELTSTFSNSILVGQDETLVFSPSQSGFPIGSSVKGEFLAILCPHPVQFPYTYSDLALDAAPDGVDTISALAAATLNENGEFTFNSSGFKVGSYTFSTKPTEISSVDSRATLSFELIPEPSSTVLAGMLLLGLGLFRRVPGVEGHRAPRT